MKTTQPSLLNRIFRNLFWYIYTGIIIGFIWDSTHSFFSEETGIPLFYTILYSFDSGLLLPYYIDVIQTILSAVLTLPLCLYVFNIKFLPKMIWKILVVVQIALSIVGNTYSKVQIKSYYLEGGPYFWIIVGALFVLYAPFYYANIRYAFTNNTPVTTPSK